MPTADTTADPRTCPEVHALLTDALAFLIETVLDREAAQGGETMPLSLATRHKPTQRHREAVCAGC